MQVPFTLVPHPSSSLPELPAGTSKLSAPRVLRGVKVASYVEGKLGGDRIHPKGLKTLVFLAFP